MFDISGILYAEQMLIGRSFEDRDLHLRARRDRIGATHLEQIAERAGIDPAAVSNYLSALVRLGLVTREVPFGEDPSRSRKGLLPERSVLLLLVPIRQPVHRRYRGGPWRSSGARSRPKGTAFPPMSERNLRTFAGNGSPMARAGNLPFLPLEIGRWWGTDP